MADGMTEEEIEACRLAFEKFDADGSGTIEANELKVTLMSMGQNPTDEEIFEMLSSVDEDGSGRCGAKRSAKGGGNSGGGVGLSWGGTGDGGGTRPSCVGFFFYRLRVPRAGR